jgi:hypothetical protein
VRKWTQENGPAIAEVIVGVRYFAAHAHVENLEDLEPVEWEKTIELMRADDGVPLALIPPSPESPRASTAPEGRHPAALGVPARCQLQRLISPAG